jgi:hypothetical protein
MYSRRWLLVAVMVCGLGASCSQFNTNLTTQTSTSRLTFLSPGTTTMGTVPSTGLPIIANGAGFISGAIILWNAGPGQVPKQLTTTFVSSNQVTATVPASEITTAGTVYVAVQIPGSAVSGTSNIYATTTTEVSNVVPFLVSTPAAAGPTVTSLSQSSTPYCGPAGFMLTVNGTNFVSGSVVNWNGLSRTTVFGSSTQLTVSILTTDSAFPGTAGISVSNPGATSSSVPFTMTTPVTSLPTPSIASLSSTTATAGAAAFTLAVTGSSFVPCSVVQWNGVVLPTTFVGATQLNATVSGADVFSPGSVPVNVFTLAPGGGNSAGSITFTVSP